MQPTKEIFPSKEEPSVAEVSFIFFYHDERGYPIDDPLFCLLEDQDLILMETVGLSSRDRSHLEDELNLVLKNPSSLSAAQVNQRNRLYDRFRKSQEIDEQIVHRFAGSDKVLRFVDISEDDVEAFVTVQKGFSLQTSVNHALLTGDLCQAKMNFTAYINNLTAEVTLRDVNVAQQIKDLLKNQTGTHQKVVVLQGFLHSQTITLFQRFSPKYPVDIHVISPFLTPEITLLKSILQGQPVSQKDFDRALLADYILLPAIANEMNNDERKSLITLSLLTKNLSDDRVALALAQFYIIFRQSLSRLTNRRTVDRQIYLPFAYAQTTASLLQMVRHWQA